MSLQDLKDITRQLGPGWKCGAIVHPPGGRCRLHLGPDSGHYNPLSELLVVEGSTQDVATRWAVQLTHEASPEQAATYPPTRLSGVDDLKDGFTEEWAFSWNGGAQPA